MKKSTNILLTFSLLFFSASACTPGSAADGGYASPADSGCIGDTGQFDQAASADHRLYDHEAPDSENNDLESSDQTSNPDQSIWDAAAVLEDATAQSDAAASACSNNGQAVVTLLSAAELHTALEHKDFLLIDVGNESPQIPGTDTYIPYTETTALQNYIGEDLAQKVVLYCVSGHRSAIASQALLELGYCAISQLDGGINAWINAGFATE